jgi:hypothetical protein
VSRGLYEHKKSMPGWRGRGSRVKDDVEARGTLEASFVPSGY